MASKLLPLRRLSRLLRHPSSASSSTSRPCFHLLETSKSLHLSQNSHGPLYRIDSKSFCSGPLNLDDTKVPAAIDYSSVLQEDDFHRLADSTIQDLQEKFEEYGDNVQVDGFDIDYGNEVLTLKLGDLGTYVLNKQTPNRQIWLSSPVRMFANLLGTLAKCRDLDCVRLNTQFFHEQRSNLENFNNPLVKSYIELRYILNSQPIWAESADLSLHHSAFILDA